MKKILYVATSDVVSSVESKVNQFAEREHIVISAQSEYINPIPISGKEARRERRKKNRKK
jgi:hypothetical protein